MTDPIVVAVSEGDQARGAIALGVTAARLLNAPLVLAGVVVTVAPAGATVVPGWGPAADPSGLRDYVAGELHRHADAVPDDVPCTIHIVTATGILPGLEIAVEREHAQLVVVGASHLGPLARTVRGDIRLGAARHVGCPVLVAPEDDRTDLGVPPRRIGVAWDGSEEAESALALAAGLTERSGAELTILRATTDDDVGEAQRALGDAVARVTDRIPCHPHLLTEPPAGALVDVSGDLDLLVMGARARTRPGSLWLGGVSTPVLRHARCPVLIVPEGAHVPTLA